MNASMQLPTPLPGLSRDACTCRLLCGRPTYDSDDLCPACQAWDQGFVLVDGERRYRKEDWVDANTVEAPMDVLRAYWASLKE
mgnify:CR=1 FL=1